MELNDVFKNKLISFLKLKMSSKTCLLLRHFIILLKVCVLWCDVNFYIYVIFLKAMCYGILKYVIFLKTMCYDI